MFTLTISIEWGGEGADIIVFFFDFFKSYQGENQRLMMLTTAAVDNKVMIIPFNDTLTEKSGLSQEDYLLPPLTLLFLESS